jgi:hypothetical protein
MVDRTATPLAIQLPDWKLASKIHPWMPSKEMTITMGAV